MNGGSLPGGLPGFPQDVVSCLIIHSATVSGPEIVGSDHEPRPHGPGRAKPGHRRHSYALARRAARTAHGDRVHTALASSSARPQPARAGGTREPPQSAIARLESGSYDP